MNVITKLRQKEKKNSGDLRYSIFFFFLAEGRLIRLRTVENVFEKQPKQDTMQGYLAMFLVKKTVISKEKGGRHSFFFF